MDLTVTIKGLGKVQKVIERQQKGWQKALRATLKVEGYRLRDKLKKEIRAGAPGGVPLAPLSEIARRTKTGRLRKNQAPLARLAVGVRYKVVSENPENPVLSVGATASRSWQKIARSAAAGGGIPPLVGDSDRDANRKALAAIGAKLRKKGDPASRFFFLRYHREAYHLPPRPAMENFWKRHRSEAERNIARNLVRKLRGERI